MKKLILLLLLCSTGSVIFAQDADTSQTKKTKIKIKSKNKGEEMMKKSNTDVSTSTTTITNTAITTANPSSTTILLATGWRTDPASLPVVGTGVSADVVANIKSKYGENIYDIKKIRSTSGQDAYAVRVMENGQYNTYYVGADGNVVAK